MISFKRILHEATLPVWIALNTFVVGVVIFAAYAGHIDQEFMPFAGVVGMTFPFWYVFALALLIIDIVVKAWRMVALLPAIAVLLCLKSWLVFAPVNFKHKSTPPSGETFKVMSYNITSFHDEENKSTPQFNRTMHQVLHSDADVVALMEHYNRKPLANVVPQSQIDSLHSIYPYSIRGRAGNALYSKRPIMHIVPPNNEDSRGSFDCFRTSVAGHPVTIFAVHLESIGLSDSDKQLYREIGVDESVNYGQVREQLIQKLYDSFSNRQIQAKRLRSYVEQMDGNVIVCGDFNDVPGCRAINILQQANMRDAYAEKGVGPCRTFNAPRFPFRIDHVLYRGNFHAVDIERGNVPSSDHYPMLTTFVWDND